MPSEQKQLQKSIEETFAVFGKKSKSQVLSSTNPSEAILKKVAEILKIDIPQKRFDALGYMDDIKEKAYYLSIPSREVVLDEDFHNHESGLFLSYSSDGKPYLLFPIGSFYYVFDPTNSKVFRYTKNMEISKDVLQFYKPFSQKEFGLKAIWRFFLEIIGSDLYKFLTLSIIITLLTLATPIAMSYLISTIIPEANKSELLEYSLGLFVFGISSLLFFTSKNFLLVKIESKLTHYLENATWHKILNFPVRFFTQYKTADLVLRAKSLDNIREILTDTVIIGIFGGIFSLATLGLLFFYSSSLALIILFAVLLFQIVYIAIALKQAKVTSEYQNHFGELMSNAEEGFKNIQKLKTSGSERRFLTRFVDQNRTQVALRYKTQKLITIEKTLDTVFMLSIPLLVYLSFAFFKTLRDELSLAEFIAINSVIAQFSQSFASFLSLITKSIEIKPYLERFMPISRGRSENDPFEKVVPKRFEGNIEFRDVFFKYGSRDKNIIKGLSLKIKSGEHIGIVGSSGSGKSTMIKLLLGFEEPSLGEIFVSGYNLKDVDMQIYRRNIGVVMQDIELTDGDIISNIRLDLKVPLKDVVEAINLSGLKYDIQQMPMGIHTMIQANGLTLSGGQRQKIAIARAILKKPKLLILDEATSAIDSKTQADIVENLKSLDMTILSVAHRVESLKNTDKIIILEEGSVKKEGSFKEIYGGEA
ncbi:MAG: ATP-binding cassette domain-containing protein [Campylobacterales bacterium]